MLKINNYLLILSLLVFIMALINRNELSHSMTFLPELKQEPKQSSTSKETFTTTFNEDSFTIMPKFEYELYGLVVSYRLHDSEHGQMIHALNKDHINVADYCVVWGENADSHLLSEFTFSNGQFTCNWQTHSNDAWKRFDQYQISNNHLLAVDSSIRDTLDQIKIGDQIYIKGQLAHYTNPMSYERGTSIVRTDTGNGACETIWVEEINILAEMNSIWRNLLWLSMGLLILTTYIYFKTPYIPHQHH